MKMPDLARALGVSVTHAYRLARMGMPTDDLATAQRWRAVSLDPARVHGGRVDRPLKSDQSINHSSADPIPDTGIPQSLYDLQLARAKREYHEANIAEMRERQKAGELVELRDVQLAYTTLYAQLRAALERIPDKLAPRLAAETHADAVHALLVVELDQCLIDMARMAEQIPDRLIDAGADG